MKSCTLVINAQQNDFLKQVEETFACYQMYKDDLCGAFPNSYNDIFLTCIIFTHEIHLALPKCIKDSALIFIDCNDNIEEQLNALEENQKSCANLYLFPSNYWGKDICTRFSVRKGGIAFNNVLAIDAHKDSEILYIKKLAYSNHALVEFQLRTEPFCLSLAKEAFSTDCCEEEENAESYLASDENIEYFKYDSKRNFIELIRSIPKEKASSLDNAKFIIVCGKGIDSKEKIQKIKELATSINAEFGVTRPVAMNAWESIDRIVGISGAICKAEICISIGASGAGAYFAGIEKCKTIIAVNTDENANIMQQADFIFKEDGLIFMETLVNHLCNS